jgi:hypothetical protein
VHMEACAAIPAGGSAYLRLANVQFDIDAEKFYKLYIDLMTRPPRKR